LLLCLDVAEYSLEIIAELGSMPFTCCPDFCNDRIIRWRCHRQTSIA